MTYNLPPVTSDLQVTAQLTHPRYSPSFCRSLLYLLRLFFRSESPIRAVVQLCYNSYAAGAHMLQESDAALDTTTADVAASTGIHVPSRTVTSTDLSPNQCLSFC